MRSLRFKAALTVSVFFFAAVVFMASPYFYVTTVRITGCDTLEESEIRARVDAEGGNIFLFNTREASRRVMENLYVDRVVFEKTLPGTLTVTVRERRLCGYVEHVQGKFLYVDENGRVLEVNPYFTEKYPIVSGLRFNRFVLGEVLEVEDSAAFKSVMLYASLFEKHDMAADVSRIDVADSANTKIHMYHLEFNVGDSRNADEKIRTIKEIIRELPGKETLRGFVDLKEIREQYVLRTVH